MKSAIRILMALFLFSVLFSLLAASGPEPDGSQAHPPFAVAIVSHDRSIVTRETSLRYTVSNHDIYPLSHLSLLIVSRDLAGRIRAAQKLLEPVNVAPKEQTTRTVRLSNLFYDASAEPANFEILVLSARTGPLLWQTSVSPEELALLVRTRGELSLKPVYQDSAPDYSATCHQTADLAQQLCGQYRTHEFSCSLTEATGAFTCKPETGM